MAVTDYVRDRTVLITGAAGTIGAALTEQLLPIAKAVRCLDHAETELFFLHQRCSSSGKMAPQLGDIRDLDRLRFAMQGVDIVFHCAALKHVGLGEYNPFEVVQTNLQGVNNVIRAALDAEVDRVVFTSSDKAVNPTNVMGASKMMGERLVIAANEIRGAKRTRFCAVRFGNVIGSRGSVVPIFAGQLLRNEPITLTDGNMTRYVMTTEEAASLVIEAGASSIGGEVFVTKMQALRIRDLATVMARAFGRPNHPTTKLGLRPGEKAYEELVSEEEIPRTLEKERLLLVMPADAATAAHGALLREYEGQKLGTKEWHSGNDRLMTEAEIADYLARHDILAPYLGGRVIPPANESTELVGGPA